MKILLSGLIAGMFFGFLLQKGRVVRYDLQVGALRLLDMTIVKFMLSAILVAMVGIYFLKDLGMVKLMFVPAVLSQNVIGGIIYGIGWGVLGYCPGTQLGALGEGRIDALWGILGMVTGAAVFAEFYPALAKGLLIRGYLGQITLPEILGVNHWVVIVGFIVFGISLFKFIEKKGL